VEIQRIREKEFVAWVLLDRLLIFGCFPLHQRNWADTWVTTRGKWNNIFPSYRANREEWLLPFFIPFPNSPHKWNLLKKRRAMIMNRFVKMERHISVQLVRLIKVDNLHRWSWIFQSDWTKLNSPFHLTSDQNSWNFWHNGKDPLFVASLPQTGCDSVLNGIWTYHKQVMVAQYGLYSTLESEIRAICCSNQYQIHVILQTRCTAFSSL